ncbi:MAG: hypothetical protein ACR2JB_06015 [Bryobacteraceae bacterium]
MKFDLPRSKSFFVIPDEWWAEANITDFTPAAPAYVSMQPPYPDDAIPPVAPLVLPVDEIKPVERDLQEIPGAPLFGSGSKERLLRIFHAIRANEPLPPVEVIRQTSGFYRYHLYHGAHRFYASIAARFTHIPAVIRPGRRL